MSVWQNIELNDVPTGRELLPAGDYTFEILAGAKAGKFDPETVDVPLAVVNPTEYAGRRVFLSYPDPGKYDWSPTAVKRASVAIGVDFDRGEQPIQYFNRVAGMRFVLPVTQKDKEGTKYQQLQSLNPKPAKG